MERHGVSERFACQVLGQHRSCQRRPASPTTDAEQLLRARLRNIARDQPRWGWKLAHRLLRNEGMIINAKRTRRLWREEGLRRPPPRCRKRRRPDPGAELLRASRPGDVWAVDFQFDQTCDGRRLKLTNIVDEYTREALAMNVARSTTAQDLVAILETLVAVHGAPVHLRMDNGPELTAHVLRDWCRTSGVRTVYIEPGSPWENPFVESFNSRVRDEHLNIELFSTLTEARILTEWWRTTYNAYRPHSSLGDRTPTQYHHDWTHQHQPTP
jgi:putative transposase